MASGCNENSEPPHIHIERDDSVCKFWVEKIALADNVGFKAKELAELNQLVVDNQDLFLKSYTKYHG